jgi:putative endonuclease
MFKPRNNKKNRLLQNLDTGQIGKRAEVLAEKYFKKNGYKILDRNYRSRYGEIDLIVEKKKDIIFVEVRFRASIDFGLPQETVIKRKQEKIKKVATQYLVQKNIWNKVDCHFDIISIHEEYGKPLIEHIKDAF